MERKRVAVLLHGLGANGIDTLFANLSSCWDLSRFDITYLLAVDEGNHQYWEDKVAANGIRVIHISDLDGKKLYRWPKQLENALRQYGPFDVIHVNMDMLNGINLRVAKKVGIPVRVCHAHNSNNTAVKNPVKAFAVKQYISIMKKYMRRYSTMRLACSDLAGDYFFGEGNYRTVYNGIDLEKFHDKDLKKRKGEQITFCTVGRLAPQKNPIFLADIINELYRLNSSIRFLWVGAGKMEKEVKDYVDSLPSKHVFSFLGVRKDIENVLAESSYFLLPSLYEGFGLVLVEAQAAGVDCFASDGVPTDIDCGKCRFIPLEKSAKQWAQEIMGVVEGKHTLELDEEKLRRFDIKNMADCLQKIYIG